MLLRWIANLVNWIFDDFIRERLIQMTRISFEIAFWAWETQMNAATETLRQTPQTFLENDLTINIYTIIENISNTVILPIAVAVFALILAHEFIAILNEGNNFREFDYSHLVKWGLKAVVGAILLTNVFPIMEWIFGIGANSVLAAQGELTGYRQDLDYVFSHLEVVLADTFLLEEVIFVWAMSFFFAIFMVVARAVILAVVTYRMLLILLKLSLAPLPFATLISREWGSVGTNYIKLMVSAAFQGFLMLIILALWGLLMSNSIAVASTAQELILMMMGMVVMSVMLIILLIKTQQIAKSVFGAH